MDSHLDHKTDVFSGNVDILHLNYTQSSNLCYICSSPFGIYSIDIPANNDELHYVGEVQICESCFQKYSDQLNYSKNPYLAVSICHNCKREYYIGAEEFGYRQSLSEGYISIDDFLCPSCFREIKGNMNRFSENNCKHCENYVSLIDNACSEPWCLRCHNYGEPIQSFYVDSPQMGLITIHIAYDKSIIIVVLGPMLGSIYPIEIETDKENVVLEILSHILETDIPF